MTLKGEVTFFLGGVNGQGSRLHSFINKLCALIIVYMVYHLADYPEVDFLLLGEHFGDVGIVI